MVKASRPEMNNLLAKVTRKLHPRGTVRDPARRCDCRSHKSGLRWRSAGRCSVKTGVETFGNPCSQAPSKRRPASDGSVCVVFTAEVFDSRLGERQGSRPPVPGRRISRGHGRGRGRGQRTCTKVRLAQMQVCPQFRKALPTTPLAARATSASSNTMNGALPPSSRLICAPQPQCSHAK